MSNGETNPAFVPSREDSTIFTDDSKRDSKLTKVSPTLVDPEIIKEKGQENGLEGGQPERAGWGNQIEFLMSCIATSVGLGNIWRFPFIAYENGGGAFLVPYIIVLFLIGKPMYYLECAIGQFSSKNSVEIWAMAPAMKGTGYAQALGCGYILSYYVSIIALCLYYLVMSFQAQLPWTICKDEWLNCVSSDVTNGTAVANAISSAELYFKKTVLQQTDGIEYGLGAPIWYLTLALLISWVIIFGVVAQGVKSSGKAAYFLALFPYVIMTILLIRSATLTGAGKGILFFLTPQWEKLLDVNVWYAALTQMFFSLTVGTGPIIMFSSYNGFRQNIYRDAMIVTTLDTLTSLMSGITIFGILGNLAYELGYDDVKDAIGGGGTGLAFISYPDAIAKAPFAPQLFSVLFFVMMSVLGIGSAVALMSTINTVLIDSFPSVKTIYMSALTCTGGFLVGLFYVTPSGQYVLDLVDHYGGTFLILFAAIAEMIGIFWIYGLENICLDIEYMLGIKTSVYWRICWGLVAPVLMIIVFLFAFFTFKPVDSGNYVYPFAGTLAGYLLLFAGIILVPIFIFRTMYKNRTGNCAETAKISFRVNSLWGPSSPIERREWIAFKEQAKMEREKVNASWFKHIMLSLGGGYKRN